MISNIANKISYMAYILNMELSKIYIRYLVYDMISYIVGYKISYILIQ